LPIAFKYDSLPVSGTNYETTGQTPSLDFDHTVVFVQRFYACPESSAIAGAEFPKASE
jgi:hypothetical protein